jgi:hypothetical protein
VRLLPQQGAEIGVAEVQPMQVGSVLFERVPISRLESGTQEGMQKVRELMCPFGSENLFIPWPHSRLHRQDKSLERAIQNNGGPVVYLHYGRYALYRIRTLNGSLSLSSFNTWKNEYLRWLCAHSCLLVVSLSKCCA